MKKAFMLGPARVIREVTLMQPHESIPYNENIANAFYYAGYIETWGRGIQKICKACAEIGADNPRYELIGNGLRVHFAALKSALSEVSQVENEKELRESTSSSQKTSLKTSLKIVELIRGNSEITFQEMANIIGIDRRNIARQIKILQAKGLIRRVGPAKGGHWEVIGEDKE